MRREANERTALAWHVAAFTRAKKLPKLKDLLDKPKKKAKRVQPWQEQLEIARRWTSVINKGKAHGR